MNDEKKKLPKVHIIFTAVLLTLALVAIVIYAIFAYSFVDTSIMANKTEDAGEKLGNGLSSIIALIFMIICGIASVVTSGVLFCVAMPLHSRTEGRARIFGRVSWIAGAVFFLGTIASFALLILLSSTGVI